MANTDWALSHASSCGQQHNETQSRVDTCGSSPKPHIMTGVYPLGALVGSTACGLNSTSTASPAPALAPAPAPASASAPRQLHPQTTTTALEQYRLQLYNYALNIERLRCPQYGTGMGSGSGSSVMPPWLHPYSPLHNAVPGIGVGVGGSRLATLSTISLFPQSQRIFQPEEPKPQHSYIGLIAMAILSSSEIKLVLSDIYQYILDNYPYFRTRGPGWRNSIRHNLSLNDCFIKSGRSANGKGHYWAIHPANMDDFRKGDFRRRKAQRKVRKHMGLSVDDASTDSPSPPPLDLTTPPPLGTAQASLQLAALNYPYHQHYIGQFFGRNAASNLPQYTTTATALQRQQIHLQQHPEHHHLQTLDPIYQQPQNQNQPHNQNHHQNHHQHQHQHIAYINSTTTTTIANLYSQTRKRQFDVASLLAPDVQIVDIVEDEEGSAPAATRTTTQTQHTVITKVQVQKQQTIHHELVVEQSSPSIKANHQLEVDAEADIDVDGDCDGDRDRDRDGDIDGEVKQIPELNHRHLTTQVVQMLSPDDNNSYLSDTRRLSFEADVEDQENHNFSASISPALGGSSVASSSQHDSNSLEECPIVAAASAAGPVSLSSTSTLASPLAMTMSLPKAYVELNHVDPHILSRYYGSYMAAAARRATLEASRAQSKSMTTPPPKELLPNKL